MSSVFDRRPTQKQLSTHSAAQASSQMQAPRALKRSSASWVAASMLFSWYVSNFADYNRTYGSLGAAIGFMTWIWISAIIVLLGGEIDAEIEREAPWQSPSGT